MNEIQALQTAATINRAAYQSKQVQIQKRNDSAQEASAKILGYDAATSMYKVQDGFNTIHYARAISNSSALHVGAYVSLIFQTGGIPIIDTMPR